MQNMNKKKWKYLLTLFLITVGVYWLFTDGFTTTFSHKLGITKGASKEVINFLRMDVNPVYVIIIVIIPILLKYLYDKKIKKPKPKIMKRAEIRKKKNIARK